jgi:hypothetical protein
MANTAIFRGSVGAHPADPKAPLLIQELRHDSRRGVVTRGIQEQRRVTLGYQPPVTATLLTLVSLAHRQAHCQEENRPIHTGRKRILQSRLSLACPGVAGSKQESWRDCNLPSRARKQREKLSTRIRNFAQVFQTTLSTMFVVSRLYNQVIAGMLVTSPNASDFGVVRGWTSSNRPFEPCGTHETRWRLLSESLCGAINHLKITGGR